MSIVCGTDFSEHAAPGLCAAGALAARLRDGELWLVHVLDGALTQEFDPVDWDKLKAKTGDRLRGEANQLRERFSLPHVYSMVLVGSSASDVLAAFARVKQAALVVVASQGHGASPLFRLGGTSERLAVISDVPALVVRDASAFESWSRGERPLRILLGVDWTTSSTLALRLVKVLRGAGPCDVIAAHVYYCDESAARYGLTRGTSWEEPDQRIEELLARDLATYVGELGGEGAVVLQPKLGVGRLGDHLLEVADAQRADLVVVGTHRRHGLRRLASVSSVILHFGHASVACVPGIGALPLDEPRSTRRILIATDLSAMSNHAISAGYGLLSQRGGEVHLLHIVHDRNHGSAAERNAALVAELRGLVPSWAAGKGIVTRTEVVDRTDVARAITEGAARVGADVVCIGSHGRSGVARVVLGSVAEQVVRESVQPVLIVRPPQR
jgi:nucleotide-binding universal stress UspA family protein